MDDSAENFSVLPTLKNIDVTVEAVVDLGHTVQITVSVDYEGNFSMPEYPSLGGKPIHPHLSQPRVLDRDGNPRFDVYNFELISKSDGGSFNRGDVVALVVDITPRGTDLQHAEQ